MKKILAGIILIALPVVAQEKTVKLSSIKDKEMIKCLSEYVKTHKTHIRMVIKDGKQELYIPESYVKYCEKTLLKQKK
ncbi:hypothetical protein [Persephonella sp. IF05-L8]|uniref:hypothetical protein n=1 Tax=Persephonella sp. IF05-L8 TaxID=1158338 RepID=UPI000497AD76